MNFKRLPRLQRVRLFLTTLQPRTRGWSWSLIILMLLSGTVAMSGQTESPVGLPKNLAPKARAAASSQFSEEYRPEKAISGALPSEFQRAGREWAEVV